MILLDHRAFLSLPVLVVGCILSDFLSEGIAGFYTAPAPGAWFTTFCVGPDFPTRLPTDLPSPSCCLLTPRTKAPCKPPPASKLLGKKSWIHLRQTRKPAGWNEFTGTFWWCSLHVSCKCQWIPFPSVVAGSDEDTQGLQFPQGSPGLLNCHLLSLMFTVDG
jgi:hypothetical protein